MGLASVETPPPTEATMSDDQRWADGLMPDEPLWVRDLVTEEVARLWELVTTRDAMLAERDATIARLQENAREMRDALSDYATPGEGWRDTWHADVFERSRRLAPDATALTPAKEADREGV
jgi:hypothetical protein